MVSFYLFHFHHLKTTKDIYKSAAGCPILRDHLWRIPVSDLPTVSSRACLTIRTRYDMFLFTGEVCPFLLRLLLIRN